jgi:hypothetical protein
MSRGYNESPLQRRGHAKRGVGGVKKEKRKGNKNYYQILLPYYL